MTWPSIQAGGGAALHLPAGPPGDRLVQDEVAVRVHDLRRQREEADQEEIALAEHQLEPAAGAEGLLGLARAGAPCRAVPLANVNEVGQDKADDQNGRGDEHHRKGAETADERRGDERADDRAGRRAEPDDGEQALPLLRRVDVVGKRPELRDHHQVEDADPEKERHAQHGSRNAARPEQEEDHEIGRKEQRHVVDQLDPVDLAREGAVRGHDEEKEPGQNRAGVRLNLRSGDDVAAGQREPDGQQQRGPDRTDHVVRTQNQKAVRREQHDGDDLARVHLRRQVQQRLEPALACWRIRHSGSQPWPFSKVMAGSVACHVGFRSAR